MPATPPSPLGLANYRYLTGTNFETGITATAGGGQATAYQLTAQMSVISTVATAGDSVVLPKSSLHPPGDSRPGSLGQLVFVANDGANACQVFGASPDTINGAATGTGISLAAGGKMIAWLVSFSQSTNVGVWDAFINTPSGTGTVTSVSVVSANGLAGTVANPTTTPAITLSTSVNGIVKGNATALSAATSGTDYSAGTSALATGILKSTTATGALSIAVAADFPTLNQNTTGTAASLSAVLGPALGGSGVANNAANTVTFSGNFSLGWTLTGNTSLTLPTSGTVATLAGTSTFTNKRITARVLSEAFSATPTINTDSYDEYHATAMSGAITSMTTNLTGTPVTGDILICEFTDNGTARAITWGASFESSTIALPTTTVISTLLTVTLKWNAATSKWRCVGVA